jgi:hypothetical protein
VGISGAATISRMCAVACAATLVACSSGSPGDPGGRTGGPASGGGTARVPGYDGPSLPPTPGPLPANQLGAAFENLLCHALIECQGAPYPDLDACLEDREPQGLQDILDGIEDGSIAYDADGMGECRRLFELNLCAMAGAFLFVPSVQDIVNLCLATRGLRADGEACRSALECRRGSFCDLDAACPGTCRAQLPVGAACTENVQCAPLVPPPEFTLMEFLERGDELVREFAPSRVRCEGDVCRAPSMPGDACSAAGQIAIANECAGDATFCDRDAALCRARLGEGESCTDSDQCGEQLWCDELAQPGTGASALGACRARGEAGAPCETASHCVSGLRCISTDAEGRGHCAPPSASGGPCAVARDCETGLGCVEGRCGALPRAAAPCAAGQRCARGFACTSASLCAELVLHGEPCDDTTRICVGLCREGTCERRAPLAASCTASQECASRACAGGICIDDELCANREP